ncbi:MAG: type VI secretion system tube protein Hcp [Caulobacter sp.]|nr:type VI secretion system tube protein Hcp [Caulobacter sp.]
MKITRTTLAMAVTAIALAIAAPAVAAGFLKFEGVDGESAAARGNLEVSSVRWGSPMRTEGCSGESGAGRLMVSGAGLRGVTPGTRIPQATLHLRKTGGDTALTYKLKDVIISSATGGAAPSESLSLNFARISWSKEGCR